MTSKREAIDDGRGANELIRVVRQRRTSQCILSVVATLSIVMGWLVGEAPIAASVANTCRAKNLTQGAPSRSNLQAVIDAAHRGDRISIEGVCVGSFKIKTDLTLVGKPTPQRAKPVLHGERGSGSVVHVAAKVTLTNLKVTGGVAKTGDGLRDQTGGGIIVRKGATLTVNRSVVRGNRAWYEGGGIANYGKLTLNGSTSVTANRASDGQGGGIANYGTLIMNGSSAVRGNTSANTGGGIRNYGTLIMNGSSSVRRNTAELGGGISFSTDHPHYVDPTVTMNDSSSVRGNTAESPDPSSQGLGGGILVWDGTLTMNDSSSVRGNHAAINGGGIWSYGTVTLKNSSSVSGNSADRGGGISNEGSLSMSGSSSVSGNSADRGGGISNERSLSMSGSSSVSGNTASDSGGIFNTGTITLEGSSSVSGNSAARGGGIGNYVDGALTLKGSSTVHDNTATTTGGGIWSGPGGIVNACDSTSVDEWIGTVEPNDPDDFLDSDVSLIPSGTGEC